MNKFKDALVNLKSKFSEILASPMIGLYIKNSSWSIVGSFFSKGINFFCIILIAKILGPKTFGEYNIVQTTIGVFGTFAGVGLGMAATKLVAEFRTRNFNKLGELIGSLYSICLVISVLVSISFYLFSSRIALSFHGNDNLLLLFQITSLVVIFDSLNGVQIGILSGLENFKLLSLLNILLGIITFPLLLLGAYENGIVGLTIMLLITKFITVIVYEYFIILNYKKVKINIKIIFKSELYRDIFKIGIPSFLGGLAQSPINWVSNFLLANQFNGYKSIGIYNASNQLRTFVLFLPDGAGKISIPMLSRLYGAGEISKFKKTALMTFIWNLLLSFAPAIFMLLFYDTFKRLLGVDYDFGINLIITVLITGIMIAVTNAVGYVFICSDLIWYDFILRIISGISMIVLIYVYGRYNGAFGYAFSVLCSTIFYLILQLLFLFKIKKSLNQLI